MKACAILAIVVVMITRIMVVMTKITTIPVIIVARVGTILAKLAELAAVFLLTTCWRARLGIALLRRELCAAHLAHLLAATGG
jgi:hypothetical protein